jgi:hypothetical protein
VTHPAPYRPVGLQQSSRPRGDTLADVLERVLDKGVVIAGDIVVNVLDIELLTLKVRLLIASVDTAKEMGIDWWSSDPFLSRNAEQLQQENDDLRQRLDRVERMLTGGNGNGSGNGNGNGGAGS